LEAVAEIAIDDTLRVYTHTQTHTHTHKPEAFDDPAGMHTYTHTHTYTYIHTYIHEPEAFDDTLQVNKHTHTPWVTYTRTSHPSSLHPSPSLSIPPSHLENMMEKGALTTARTNLNPNP